MANISALGDQQRLSQTSAQLKFLSPPDSGPRRRPKRSSEESDPTDLPRDEFEEPVEEPAQTSDREFEEPSVDDDEEFPEPTQ